MTPRRKRIVLFAVLVAVTLLLAALVMVKVPPGAYVRAGEAIEDPEVRRAALEQFDEQVVNGVGNVLADQSGRTRLDVALTEEMVNARLRLYLDESARNGERVSPAIAALRVAFEPGRMVLATRIGHGATSVVATQEVRLVATGDGLLKVEMGELRAGWLPVPRAVADELRASLRQAAARSGKGEDALGAGDLWRVVVEAMDGEPKPLGRGKKQIVLDKLEIERGSLHVEGHKGSAKRAEPH